MSGLRQEGRRKVEGPGRELPPRSPALDRTEEGAVVARRRQEEEGGAGVPERFEELERETVLDMDYNPRARARRGLGHLDGQEGAGVVRDRLVCEMNPGALGRQRGDTLGERADVIDDEIGLAPF